MIRFASMAPCTIRKEAEEFKEFEEFEERSQEPESRSQEARDSKTRGVAERAVSGISKNQL